jgi:23S rRNA pseudouridine1911/1915/1917 synthase
MSQHSSQTPAPGDYSLELTEAGRIDAVAARALEATRTQVARWVSEGHVRINGQSVLKPSVKVAEGDLLEATVPVDESLIVKAEVVDGLGILYDDEHIVIVDKPVGVAAHPSPGWHGATVVGALAGAGYEITTSGAQERAGIVHRLDVGTSGAMVVAKTEQAYTRLKAAFKERTVEKIYHAVVQGLPDPLKGTINAPIGRHPGHDWKFAVVEGGRDSVTHYEVLEAFGLASLLEIHLETGRTHQIRVHFAALRHPCAGDLMYGADAKLAAELGLTRQWLHAHRLAFDHPVTGERVSVTSPYPQDLEYAVRHLRGEITH